MRARLFLHVTRWLGYDGCVFQSRTSSPTPRATERHTLRDRVFPQVLAARATKTLLTIGLLTRLCGSLAAFNSYFWQCGRYTSAGHWNSLRLPLAAAVLPPPHSYNTVVVRCMARPVQLAPSRAGNCLPNGISLAQHLPSTGPVSALHILSTCLAFTMRLSSILSICKHLPRICLVQVMNLSSICQFARICPALANDLASTMTESSPRTFKCNEQS